MKLPIYLDYSATTPVDPRVVDKMIPYLREHFGNPASRSHAYGWEAEKAVEEAREQVARLVNADAREIIWTSGATESTNLAVKGAAHFYRDKGRHLVTVKTEHKATLDTMRELEREGYEVTYLDVLENGLLDLEAFKAALRPDTIVVSVLFEAAVLGLLGGVVGGALVYFGLNGYQASTLNWASFSQIAFAFTVTPRLLVTGLLYALLLGLVGGLLPGLRAARLPVTVGLREL